MRTEEQSGEGVCVWKEDLIHHVFYMEKKNNESKFKFILLLL